MVFNYNTSAELLRKVKMCLIPWRAYMAGKGPQKDMGVTKRKVGRITGGNHLSFCKFLEVKELDKTDFPDFARS